MEDANELGPDEAYDLVAELDFQMFDELAVLWEFIEDGRWEAANAKTEAVEDFAEDLVDAGEDSGEDHYVQYGEFVLDSCEKIREAIEDEDRDEIDDILETMEHTGALSFYTPWDEE